MKHRNGDSKAIPTRYRGYHFRSRLEARWAVFFDHLGVDWEYEKEGYDLTEYQVMCNIQEEIGCYLPDFWLPQKKWWVELKGGLPGSHFIETLEECKMWALVDYTKAKSGLVFFGLPDFDTPASSVDLRQSMRFDRYDCDSILLFGDVYAVLEASNSAKSARFEHGESGRT